MSSKTNPNHPAEEGGSSERTAVRTDPSTTKSSRSRQGPKTRKQVNDSSNWADTTDGGFDNWKHKLNKNQNKKKNKPRKEQDESLIPQPGKYPIVFDAVSGHVAAVRELMDIDYATILDHSTYVIENLENTPAWEKATAHYTVRDDPIRRLELDVSLHQSALVAAMQNVVACEKERSNPIGSNNHVLRTDFATLRPLRDVANQCGSFTDDSNAIKYEIADVSVDVKRVSRSIQTLNDLIETDTPGNKAIAQTELAARVRLAQARLWLPTDVGDEAWKVRTRILLQQWLDGKGLSYILVDKNLPIWTNVQPPWFAHAVEKLTPKKEEPYTGLDWLFKQNPLTAPQMVAALNKAPQSWYDLTWLEPVKEMATGAKRNIVERDLMFNVKPRDVIEKWQLKWKTWETTFSQFFQTAGSNSTSTEGSLAQFLETEDSDEIVTARAFRPLTHPAMGLQAAFPVRARELKRERTRRSVTTVTSLDLNSIKAAFVSQCQL